MRLTDKVAKLVNGKAYPSILRHARRHVRHFQPSQRPIKFDPASLTRNIDAKKFAEIRRAYGVDSPGDAPPKYLDLEHWMQINLRRVRELDLDRGQPRRILDLGCGAGYFLYICQQLGHGGLGVDIEGDAMFAELVALLHVQRVICEIRPFVPLPDLGSQFDVITAHMICFNGHKSETLWGVAEWAFFLDDLATRLNPGGRVCLWLNQEFDGTYYTPELKSYFESRAAKIHLQQVLFDPLPALSQSQLPSERASRY